MPIYFFHEQVKDEIKGEKRKISSWISCTINNHKKQTGNINIIFCSNDYLLQINKQFLNHNYYTDVITFSYNENNVISGDIFISTEQVKENARELEQTYKEELLRVIIHGVLHLLGFKDDTKENRLQMQNVEDIYLEKILSGF